MKKLIQQSFLDRNIILFSLPVIILFIACEPSKTFSTQYGEINKITFTEIAIVQSQGKKQNTISITNKDSVSSFINNLNKSKIDGPWKGANWDKILVIGKDTTITLSTNGKVFGFGSSGSFYKLSNEYKKLWDIKE